MRRTRLVRLHFPLIAIGSPAAAPLADFSYDYQDLLFTPAPAPPAL